MKKTKEELKNFLKNWGIYSLCTFQFFIGMIALLEIGFISLPFIKYGVNLFYLLPIFICAGTTIEVAFFNYYKIRK